MAQNIKLNTVVEGTLDVSGDTSAGTVTLDGKLWFEGPSSSYLIGVQDGNGRIQHKWNATSGTAEKYLVSGEPALKWDLDPITPATDLWSIDYAGNGTAGGTISWTRVLSVGTTNFEYYGNDIFHEGNKTSLTITESQISDLGTYEPAFTKNTAFNDNYGSAAGTVCQGNDSRLSNARTPTAHTHTEADITDLGNYEPAFTKNTAFNDNYGTTAGTVTQGNDSRLSNARTPTAHNHDGSDITSGTVAVVRLPNHDALTGFVANEHLDWTTDRGANNIHANNILAATVTQHQGSINHDALSGFVSNEHINWTADAGGNNIHVNNITAVPQSAVTAHQASLTVTESQISDLSNYLVKNVASEFTTQAISFRLTQSSAADFNGIEFRLNGTEGAGKFGGVYGNQINQTNQNVSLFKSIGAVVQSEVKVEDGGITLDTDEVIVTSPETAWTNSQPTLQFRAGSTQSTIMRFRHNNVQRSNIEAAPASLNLRRFASDGTTEKSALQIGDEMSYYINQVKHTEFHTSGATNKFTIHSQGSGSGDVSELEMFSGIHAMRIAAAPSMTNSYTVRMPTSGGSVGQKLEIGSTSGQFINMIWA